MLLRIYKQMQISESSTSRQDKRKAFHKLKIKGEISLADEKAAKTFPLELAKIIENGGYVPDQIFNADETGLFLKKIQKKLLVVL